MNDFKKWRSPIRGSANPECMDNEFWKWCIETGESAYSANEKFGGPDPFSSGPCWSFDRLGQASVTLPDGRIVYIAGEHEDHYDPDFYIYNDVVIKDGNDISIYGYPESVFPPTDFHSATLVESTIFLIGNVGYPEERRVGETQVLRLNTNDWIVSFQPTTGELPGWISNHSATYDSTSHSILVSGGQRCGERLTENFEDYRLCLESFRWSKITNRNWQVWILEREDEEINNLWAIRNEASNRELGLSTREMLENTLPDTPKDIISEMMPTVTDQQVAEIPEFYRSPVDNSLAEEDSEEYGRYRYTVNGTVVRFDESLQDVTVTIEGTLAEEVTDQILSDLQRRLNRLEQTEYIVVRVS